MFKEVGGFQAELDQLIHAAIVPEFGPSPQHLQHLRRLRPSVLAGLEQAHILGVEVQAEGTVDLLPLPERLIDNPLVLLQQLPRPSTKLLSAGLLQLLKVRVSQTNVQFEQNDGHRGIQHRLASVLQIPREGGNEVDKHGVELGVEHKSAGKTTLDVVPALEQLGILNEIARGQGDGREGINGLVGLMKSLVGLMKSLVELR